MFKPSEEISEMLRVDKHKYGPGDFKTCDPRLFGEDVANEFADDGGIGTGFDHLIGDQF